MKIDHVVALVQSVVNDDKKRQEECVSMILADCKSSGKNRIAERIEHVIKNKKRIPTLCESPFFDQFTVAKAWAKRCFGIIEETTHAHEIARAIAEQMSAQALKENGLDIGNRIILHGEPGTGKTTLAKIYASLTGREVLSLKTGLILSSLLGESSKNISKAFDFAVERARQVKTIIFIDEVDSIAQSRSVDDSSASRQLNSAVNELLVCLDRLSDHVPVICSTNRVDILDRAFLSRFNRIVEVGFFPIVVYESMFDSMTDVMLDDSLRNHMLSIRDELITSVIGKDLRKARQVFQDRAREFLLESEPKLEDMQE